MLANLFAAQYNSKHVSLPQGIAKVGAVDADAHKSFTQKYGVTGFPTIKIFTGSKQVSYQGQRNAEGFVDAALKAVKEKAYDNLGKKPSSSSDKVNSLISLNSLLKSYKPILRTTQTLNSSSLSDESNRNKTHAISSSISENNNQPMVIGSSVSPINERKAKFLESLRRMLENYKSKNK